MIKQVALENKNAERKCYISGKGFKENINITYSNDSNNLKLIKYIGQPKKITIIEFVN